MTHPPLRRPRNHASSSGSDSRPVKYKAGDLVRLVARFPDLDTVLVGALDVTSDDPDLEAPVGTVCTVTRRFESGDVISQLAYVVLIEIEGRSQEKWAYEDELELVQASR